jgi:hypothetical protein
MLTSKETIRSFSRELEGIMEKEALDVTLPMVMGGLGAAGGGLASYKTTKNPSKKLRNALIAALLTGGAGYGAGKLMEGSPGGQPSGGASMGEPYGSGTPLEQSLQMSLPEGIRNAGRPV